MLEDLDLSATYPRRGAITQPQTRPGLAHNVANNLYTLPYKHQQLKYMHQSFFSPPIQTITKAAKNNQLQGIPCLNSPKIVQKYLAPSPATSKGQLKKQRANVRTTRPKKREEATRSKNVLEAPSPASSIPNTNVIFDTHSASNVLCCTALGDATTGTFYTDMTGAFPFTSLENM